MRNTELEGLMGKKITDLASVSIRHRGKRCSTNSVSTFTVILDEGNLGSGLNDEEIVTGSTSHSPDNTRSFTEMLLFLVSISHFQGFKLPGKIYLCLIFILCAL